MKVEIKCDNCGKKFWRTQSLINKNKRHNFCGRDCMFEYRKDNNNIIINKYMSDYGPKSDTEEFKKKLTEFISNN